MRFQELPEQYLVQTQLVCHTIQKSPCWKPVHLNVYKRTFGESEGVKSESGRVRNQQPSRFWRLWPEKCTTDIKSSISCGWTVWRHDKQYKKCTKFSNSFVACFYFFTYLFSCFIAVMDWDIIWLTWVRSFANTFTHPLFRLFKLFPCKISCFGNHLLRKASGNKEPHDTPVVKQTDF